MIKGSALYLQGVTRTNRANALLILNSLVCTVIHRGWTSKLLGAFKYGLVGDKAELGNDHQEQRTPES